jgi:hypothetical protein
VSSALKKARVLLPAGGWTVVFWETADGDMRPPPGTGDHGRIPSVHASRFGDWGCQSVIARLR